MTAFSMRFYSCRRPVTYGITVHELGEDKVHEFQGKEPSGRKQSAIALDINSKFWDKNPTQVYPSF